MKRDLLTSLRKLACCAIVCVSLPALAQDAEPMVYCEYQPSLEDLVGDYTVITGPGFLISGGNVVPLPQVQTSQATLALVDGALVFYADDVPPVELMPVGDDEHDWTWSKDDIHELSSRELSLVKGCDVNSLLRLTGKGIGTSQEGRQFEFSIRIFAESKGVLSAGESFWIVDGMAMRTRVSMEAVGR
ncbi:hypothetical protein [Celeribacter sp.]|uniref:hypothetical protein n=1 Tax=Celeribacter sp. TaxID=1890673 RepID=UPI003A8D4FFA